MPHMSSIIQPFTSLWYAALNISASNAAVFGSSFLSARKYSSTASGVFAGALLPGTLGGSAAGLNSNGRTPIHWHKATSVPGINLLGAAPLDSRQRRDADAGLSTQTRCKTPARASSRPARNCSLPRPRKNAQANCHAVVRLPQNPARRAAHATIRLASGSEHRARASSRR